MNMPVDTSQRTRLLPMVPQLVPSQACFTCEVCCRFPEMDSFLRPYFTAEEITRAVALGIEASHFPNPRGGQIALVPHPSGEGFICPAFDVDTSRCRIYPHRPLDCRLYPYAIMWDSRSDEVVLGWDTKCPFMAGAAQPDIAGTGEQVALLLEREETASMLAHHTRLIGRFQDDVSPLRRLPRVGEALQRTVGALTLKPLTPQDRPRVEAALAAARTHMAAPLAAFSFAGQYLWHSLLDYSWAEIERHLCLFAASPDGMFMPLPPLGPGPLKPPLEAALRYMRIRNRGSSATRIENVPAEYLPDMARVGLRHQSKEPDYLYRASDLADLPGDRYKSQRTACNRFEREFHGICEPYQVSHRAACLELFRTWRLQKEASDTDEWGRLLLADAASAHEVALNDPRAAGLVGAVVTVRGAVRAYTFGMWLTPTVFCVVLEVADRTVPGLAQFIFRECARAALVRGAEYINTMDDSGLPTLAKSKGSYHPAAMLANFTVTEG
ncbi:MAG TPA: phosphatidylglycerol lysyltransferase domain-containing protein [Nitrospiraceae bacterium]|nr:phosphatidylglycerol lysyltransferase domain-containing protein [Nitrospiraceae bacterium]